MAKLRVEQRDEFVRILVLDNEAKRNAVDPALLGALRAAAEEAADDGTRCLILTGAGPKAFSAGYDLNLLREGTRPEEELPDLALQRALQALERTAPPVIAAVGGVAYGAGAELAAACDLRVAASNAAFSMPPARLGIVYAPEGLQRFVELVGVSWTRRLFFTGEAIDAELAARIGLVEEVVPEGTALDAALELADRIAANAPLAVQGMSRILRLMQRRELPFPAVAEVEALRRGSFASADAKEGVAAVLEKRRPNFKGK